MLDYSILIIMLIKINHKTVLTKYNLIDTIVLVQMIQEGEIYGNFKSREFV